MGKRSHVTGVAADVRRRVLSAQDRFWTYRDFDDLPATAVAQALSRLVKAGELSRVKRGLYYRPRPTAFGASVPSLARAAAWTLANEIQPAGLSASNLLGLTSQNAPHGEYAVLRPAAPTWLRFAQIHTGRSPARQQLRPHEAALLEVLRDRARDTELDVATTQKRLGGVIGSSGAFGRLRVAALHEPPRVRAMLGALAQAAGVSADALRPLRESLPPLSRYDFGRLRTIPNAREWQAL